MRKTKIKPEDLIIYQDDDYIIINKPAFLSTLEDRANTDNVLSLFRKIMPEVHVCHRLDKQTSGALLLAKNEEAYTTAALQFQNREVEKVYHALVKGRFPEEVLQVDVPLRTTSSGKVRTDPRKGKEATTIFRAKQYFKNYTLVEAKPVTGRTHQIRVHLAYLDYPICGDKVYGGSPIYLSEFKKGYKPKQEMEERPIFDRVALHAYSILINNRQQNNISQKCDYPSDLSMLLMKLQKFN